MDAVVVGIGVAAAVVGIGVAAAVVGTGMAAVVVGIGTEPLIGSVVIALEVVDIFVASVVDIFVTLLASTVCTILSSRNIKTVRGDGIDPMNFHFGKNQTHDLNTLWCVTNAVL